MIHCLTSVLVRLEDVAVDARTKVRTLGVGAALRAEPRRCTLVQILAGAPVRTKFFARRTDAECTEWCFLATVGTETDLMLTLGQIAANPFIRTVRAVQRIVADGG